MKNTMMPTLFIGHGSPMNALSHNNYSAFLNQLGEKLPRPKAILVVSAHWVTEKSAIEKVATPKTIHDFYGFPDELFKIQYPAPGAPDLADEIQKLTAKHHSITDSTWGLDHGTWSVLRHLYPKADIPVLQLSLNASFTPRQHLALAEDLRPLREQGILILGSGNITHNLRKVDFRDNAPPMSWAAEFDHLIEQALLKRNLTELLIENPQRHQQWKEAHPSLEHYLPLIYALGASRPEDHLHFPYTEIQNGSLSMRSVQWG